jgi:hypothetical protein
LMTWAGQYAIDMAPSWSTSRRTDGERVAGYHKGETMADGFVAKVDKRVRDLRCSAE